MNYYNNHVKKELDKKIDQVKTAFAICLTRQHANCISCLRIGNEGYKASEHRGSSWILYSS